MTEERGGGNRLDPGLGDLLRPEALEQVFDDCPSLVYVKDRENRFTYANAALCRLFGRPREQVVGRTTHDLLPAEVADQHVENDERVLRDAVVVQAEETNPEADGVHIYHSLKYPVRAPGGAVIAVCGISTDVTEQSRREQRARHGEESFRALLDAVTESALLLDVEGTLLAVNDTAARRLGYGVEDLVGRPIWDFLPPAVAEARMAAVAEVVLTRRPLQFKDVRGGRIILNSISPIFDEHGEVVQVAAFGVDETDTSRASAFLRESEERFRTLFESMAQGVIYQDPDGQVIAANPAALGILGVTSQELLGRSSAGPGGSVVREDGSDLPFDEQPAMMALRTGEEVRDVVIGVRNPSAGATRWISVSAVPQFKPGEDRPFRVFTTIEDVTAYREALSALAASEEQYRMLAETVTDVVVRGTAQGDLLWVSPSVKALLGWAPEELEGSSMMDLVHPDDRASMGRAMEDVPRLGKIRQEIRLRTTDGGWRWVSDSARSICDESGAITGVVAGWRDIHAEVTVRDALTASERTFRTVADFAYDWEYWRAPDGRLLWVSPSSERVTGYTAEEFMDDEGLLLSVVHEDDLERMHDHFALWRLPSDGSTEYDLEFRIRTKDGRVRWIGHRCHRVVLLDGTDLGIRSSNRDVTDRRRAQEEILRLNEELEERVRRRTVELELANKELEAFAYSVSHDLRAPLRSIDGFSEIVVEEAAERLTDDELGHLARVRTAAQRMGVLIDELLGLSRVSRRDLHLCEVDLSEQAHEVLTDLAEAHPGRQVECAVAPGLTVQADRELTRIMLTNLLANAWKFTGQHETARIEVGTTVVAGERVFFVRDDGAGFDPRYAGQLFAAFQRLHRPEEFEGHGIGLATVERIVSRHGGRVWAEAEVGKGATFFFTLAPPRA